MKKKISYYVQFAPRYLPYEPKDRYQICYNIKVGGMKGVIVVKSFSTSEEAIEELKILIKKEGK